MGSKVDSPCSKRRRGLEVQLSPIKEEGAFLRERSSVAVSGQAIWLNVSSGAFGGGYRVTTQIASEILVQTRYDMHSIINHRSLRTQFGHSSYRC